jgi:hypothetical protein
MRLAAALAFWLAAGLIGAGGAQAAAVEPAWSPADAERAIELLGNAPANGLRAEDYGYRRLAAWAASGRARPQPDAEMGAALTVAMSAYLTDLHR